MTRTRPAVVSSCLFPGPRTSASYSSRHAVIQMLSHSPDCGLAFSHPCFSEFRLPFCSFIHSTNIYLVPVVCQTHHRHSGCPLEQDKGLISGAGIPSACSSFSSLLCLPSIFFPISLFLTWPTIVGEGGLSDFYLSLPLTCVPWCLVVFSCQEEEAAAPWPDSGIENSQLQPHLQPFILTFCVLTIS